MDSLKYILLVSVLLFISQASADVALTSNSLTYVGAFRVPASQNIEYAAEGLAYNPDNDSLFIVGNVSAGYVIEISIPTPVNSGTLGNLNTATVIQSSVDALQGTLGYVGSGGSYVDNGGVVGGVLYNGSKLIINQFAYYDAEYQAVLAFASINSDWSSTVGFSGMKSFYSASAYTTGQVAGYMCPIPSAWQASLGGSALTGQSILAIVDRSSVGPSAWVFDPDDVGVTEPIPATNVLGYQYPNWTLGDYAASNSTIGGADKINGVVWPDGASTVLFFGRHGDTYCYGTGAQCSDPYETDQGVHGYPYHSYIWAYDANDLVAAKEQSQTVYAATPAWTWAFESQLNGLVEGNALINGAAYDPTNHWIFLTAAYADTALPIVHVFEVDLSGTQNTPSVSGMISSGIKVNQ